jgi:hypothetical protein
MATPRRRALEAALEIIGSEVRLAEALGISIAELKACLTGEADLPSEAYFCALGIASSNPHTHKVAPRV